MLHNFKFKADMEQYSPIQEQNSEVNWKHWNTLSVWNETNKEFCFKALIQTDFFNLWHEKNK